MLKNSVSGNTLITQFSQNKTVFVSYLMVDLTVLKTTTTTTTITTTTKNKQTIHL